MFFWCSECDRREIMAPQLLLNVPIVHKGETDIALHRVLFDLFGISIRTHAPQVAQPCRVRLWGPSIERRALTGAFQHASSFRYVGVDERNREQHRT